jgi:hypothetical protein
MLELNERIEEAEGASGDGARAGLGALRSELEERRDSLLTGLGASFAALPPAGDPLRGAALGRVRETLNAVAYLQGLVIRISAILVA